MAITRNNIAAITSVGIEKLVIDSVFLGSHLLGRLKEQEGVWRGRKHETPFFYKDDQAYPVSWYQGAEQLETSEPEIVTSQSFEICELQGAMMVSGRDFALNSGPEGIVDIVKTRMEGLEKALRQYMTRAIMGSRTDIGADTKKVYGFLNFLKDAAVNYGGISSADFAGYVSNVLDNGGVPRALSTSLDQSAVGLASYGELQPTLRFMRQATMDSFIELLKPHQRTTREESLSGLGHKYTKGKNVLVYSGIDSIVDNLAPEKSIVYINEKRTRLFSHPKYNMVRKDYGDMESCDAILQRVFWKGSFESNELRTNTHLKDLIS